MGENFDETTLQSGKKATTRNRERTLLEIVRRIFAETGETVNLADVLTEAGRLEINRDTAEDIIEALCRDGRLMRLADMILYSQYETMCSYRGNISGENMNRRRCGKPCIA